MTFLGAAPAHPPAGLRDFPAKAGSTDSHKKLIISESEGELTTANFTSKEPHVQESSKCSLGSKRHANINTCIPSAGLAAHSEAAATDFLLLWIV